MRRREFITLLGSTVAWPLGARAQQTALPVIGFINSASSQGYATQVEAFLKGLGEGGYVEGRNVAIEYRWADSKHDLLPALAADLIHRQVTVIAATTTAAAVAAKAATTTVPIIFEMGGDPVRVGLVSNLARPGGNITGVTNLNVVVAPKRLELLHELVPNARVMALLVDPTEQTSAETTTRDVQAVARTFGLELHILNASSQRDFDAAFANVVRLRAGGLVIGASALFISLADQLAALAVRHSMPAAFETRQFVQAGGLLSYSGNLTDSYRLAGVYVARILKGEKPGDLPVQLGTKAELYINLKTAKALGITVPLPLSGRADELIE